MKRLVATLAAAVARGVHVGENVRVGRNVRVGGMHAAPSDD